MGRELWFASDAQEARLKSSLRQTISLSYTGGPYDEDVDFGLARIVFPNRVHSIASTVPFLYHVPRSRPSRMRWFWQCQW